MGSQKKRQFTKRQFTKDKFNTFFLSEVNFGKLVKNASKTQSQWFSRAEKRSNCSFCLFLYFALVVNKQKKY